MRFVLQPESLFDRLALWSGRVPEPLLFTHPSLLLGRALMVGCRLGLFEALAAGPLLAAEVAARAGTDPAATAPLLATLTAAGYLEGDTRGAYRLTAKSRRWLLAASPDSVVDSLAFRELEWQWMGRLGEFVESGQPIDFHRELDAAGWGLYQRAMKALARLAAPEVVWRTPAPRGARTLLDLGGGHGHFAAAFCRRHPDLRAEVLDLAPAVESAASLLAAEGLGDRIRHRVGDAASADLGEGCWDVIFVAQLLHHLDGAACQGLIRRAAVALRPGGVLVVQELFAPAGSRRRSQLEALGHLYFALTSGAGLWSAEQVARWQHDAGLTPRRPLRLRTLPGVGQQSAGKPRG